MSFWKRLFGFDSPAQPRNTPKSTQDVLLKWNRAARALIQGEANGEFVRDALNRLEAAGLRIDPTLNRELIVIRALRGMANDCEGGDLNQFFAEGEHPVSKNSPDLLLLMELAGETDAFYGFEDVDLLDTALPNCADLDTQQIQTLLEAHSKSIFQNANSICMVNEHLPETFIEEMVRPLEELARGDFTVRSVVETNGVDRLGGQIVLADERSVVFEIENAKRADVTPLLLAMNAVIAPLGKGTFTFVSKGDGENLIAIYLRPDEQMAFSRWAQQQHYANGSLPPDLLE